LEEQIDIGGINSTPGKRCFGRVGFFSDKLNVDHK
jgi:hypothetical protein